MRRTLCPLMLTLIAWLVPQALAQARPGPVAVALVWRAEAEYGSLAINLGLGALSAWLP